MSWIHQGRQEHGWFGHGRAPQPMPFVRLARMDGLTGQHPANPQASTPARYIAADPEQWIGRDSVGSGECVDLVKAAAGTPPTKFWKPGRLVMGDQTIPRGAIIATFDEKGGYLGHAAIYLGQDAGGIRAVDQWNNRDPDTRILISKQKPRHHYLEFRRPLSAGVNRGEIYRVVE